MMHNYVRRKFYRTGPKSHHHTFVIIHEAIMKRECMCGKKGGKLRRNTKRRKETEKERLRDRESERQRDRETE